MGVCVIMYQQSKPLCFLPQIEPNPPEFLCEALCFLLPPEAHKRQVTHHTNKKQKKEALTSAFLCPRSLTNLLKAYVHLLQELKKNDNNIAHCFGRLLILWSDHWHSRPEEEEEAMGERRLFQNSNNSMSLKHNWDRKRNMSCPNKLKWTFRLTFKCIYLTPPSPL